MKLDGKVTILFVKLKNGRTPLKFIVIVCYPCSPVHSTGVKSLLS